MGLDRDKRCCGLDLLRGHEIRSSSGSDVYDDAKSLRLLQELSDEITAVVQRPVDHVTPRSVCWRGAHCEVAQ